MYIKKHTYPPKHPQKWSYTLLINQIWFRLDLVLRPEIHSFLVESFTLCFSRIFAALMPFDDGWKQSPGIDGWKTNTI